MNKESHEFALKIADILNEKKGRDIVIIDVEEKTIVADYFVIAGAKSSTAVKALADNVEDKIAKEGREPLRVDGFNGSSWVVIDYGNVLVHVFHEETREYYHLERLWIDGANAEYVGDKD